MATGAFIREHRAQIVDAWRARVERDVYRTHALSVPALVDDLPTLLDHLGEWLDSGRPLSVETFGDANAHAMQRLRLGVELRAIHREYGALRCTILELLAADPALVRLNQALDQAITEAVERYTEAKGSELRRAEERLRTSLDAAGIGTWDYDPISGELALSSRSRELFGFSREARIDYEQFVAAVHREDWPRVEDAGRRALDPDHDGSFSVEYRIAGTSERWVFATGKVFFSDRHPVRFIGTVVDISERRRAERERDMFIGALGHDLRNPLAAIGMAAALLGEQGGLAGEAAAKIGKSVRRMTKMVDELLVFARSRVGTLRLHLDSVDLGDVCREVVSETALAFPARRIELTIRGRAAGQWDRERLAQIVQNLVVNALQHGRPDRPVMVAVDSSVDVGTFAVANEGPPIPDEVLRNLFDPFRRAATKRGVGLGLYIAYQLVHAHGGTIDVTSERERTVFRVSLPCGHEQPELAADGAAPA